MSRGLPREGEGGLDQTGLGRTYWGGALFCLEADVTMREKHTIEWAADGITRDPQAHQRLRLGSADRRRLQNR